MTGLEEANDITDIDGGCQSRLLSCGFMLTQDLLLTVCYACKHWHTMLYQACLSTIYINVQQH